MNVNNNDEEMISLAENIITNEEGEQVYLNEIKNEIRNIEKNRELFKIDYITVMLVGKSGVGKSTLINNLLQLNHSNEAPTGTGNFQTTEIKSYTSDAVPFLRLIDTRGIELNVNYGKDEILRHAKEFINKQLEEGNTNNFVQCI